MGAPCIIGRHGVEQVIEVELDEEETIAIGKCIESTIEMMQDLDMETLLRSPSKAE